MGNAQIMRIIDAACNIGDNRKGAGRNDHRHRRQAIQPIGQIDRIARPHDHESGKGEIENAQRNIAVLQEGHIKVGAGMVDDDPRRNARHGKFSQQPHLARNARRAALGHLVIVIEKADDAKADGHRNTGPNERIGQIHPDQHRCHQRDQDHQPAHRRRATLGEMRFGAVFADRLALALLDPQHGDETRTNDQSDNQRRH